MCESVAVLRELTPRAQDALVARGERVLARIFAAVLARARASTRRTSTPTDVIVTERRLGSLWPNFAALRARREEARRAAARPRAQVVVMPGFLGRGPDGEVVTLGRGGTDFSAAILARSLDARRGHALEGSRRPDDRRSRRACPSARVLAELHYREAAELAYYGAKVLHPRTMIPLVDRKIPLFVRNTFRDERRARASPTT